MQRQLGLGRRTLRWLTVLGPATYLALVATGVLHLHPHPLPGVWPAFFVLLALSAVGTFVFSRFVFAHVQRQEQEIVRQTQQLAGAREAMAVVQERQRIARELHDSLAQSLGYLHLRLADVERRLAAGQSTEVAAEIGDLKQVTREAYGEVRQAIFGLRSMVSRGLGLIPTLAEYLHDWSRRTGIAVDLKAGSPEAIEIPPVVEVQLIRVIQEAMANVRKHSGAARVLVRAERNGHFAAVSIEDDGVGFDPQAVARERGRSFGIETMRERAEAVGGTFTLASRRGHGTTVAVRVPVGDLGRRQP